MKRERYDQILMIAIAALVAAWLGFVWTAATGLTLTAHSRPGRFATEDDRARVQTIAVLTTVIVGPVALWAAMKRRE